MTVNHGEAGMPGSGAAVVHQPFTLQELSRSAPLHSPETRDLLQNMASRLEALSRRVDEHLTCDAAPAELSESRAPGGAAGIRYLHGLTATNEAIASELDRAREEILTAQPDGPRPKAVLEQALASVQDKLAHGVRMRTLYQHTTRFHEPTKQYVRSVARYGVEIRTLDEFFNRLIIVDRCVAFVPANADKTSAVRVSDAALVRFLTDIFERAWDRAETYPFVPTRAANAASQVIPSIRDSIRRLLVQGRSDRQIARRMGISQRSLQSHVACLKEEFGAQHRLQLGYLIGLSEAGATPANQSSTPSEPQADLDSPA
ncbi:LuxR C-terminal-related transcriptional regulator [Salinactinospora qingdaonensis]|uniref:HTH luxR-type domain-containing protein n=1 Tax=Salinactinospora qingdaonensis TaxID=702744 RepID=A0ABP7ESY8_9ACTN